MLASQNKNSEQMLTGDGIPLKKKLSKALNDNIDRFEENFGSIKDYENPNIQLNFGPTGKA